MIIKCPEHLINIYGKHNIHKSVKVGSFVEIQDNVNIGENSVISSHSFLCSGVRIGKNCFVGHFFCTTNDKNPIPNNPNFKLEKTIIEDNVSIGSNVTILPGLTIGKNSVIGAGSVVTKNIPPYEIWCGNPAKRIGDVK